MRVRTRALAGAAEREKIPQMLRRNRARGIVRMHIKVGRYKGADLKTGHYDTQVASCGSG